MLPIFTTTFELNEAAPERLDAAPAGPFDLDLHFALFFGEAASVEPVRFAFEGGGPGDLIVADDAVSRLVSARLRAALTEAGCTGWSSYPVILEGPNGVVRDEYTGLTVTGRCGRLDASFAERITEDGWPLVRGITFDPESWDGSDVFTPPETAFVLLSERAQAALDGAGLANVEMRRLKDVVVDPEIYAVADHESFGSS